MYSERLGTAQLEEAARIAEDYPYSPGTFWIGRALHGPAIGYDDDRHVCVLSGTRGGKGTSIIITNLCLWPGSVVILDQKGENATVTAARRGQGDEHCTGMGQDVHVLDPFDEAKVDACYHSSFNPLAGLDIDDKNTIREVSRIAASIVIVDENSENKAWDEQARTLIRGIILHVLSWDRFEGMRNLMTVAELVQCGDQLLADRMRMAFPDKKIEQPHLLLFRDMQLNPAFGGRVARIGSQFRTMIEDAAKQFQGVLHSANANLEFVDDPGMMRVLSGEGRTFQLSDLKTNPRGVTLYLCLPARAINDTYFRWLRMMVDLITTQMEITRVKPPRSKAAPTATGYRLLMILDEFQNLGRMAIIQRAAAYIAGFGMKIVFIVQTLPQLHEIYKEGWETFFSNAGLKIAFSIDDNFSRDYLSKQIGDTEIVRELQSSNQSQSENKSVSEGTSESEGVSHSITEGTSVSKTTGKSISQTKGTSLSRSAGTSKSRNHSESASLNRSTNTSESTGTNQSSGWSYGQSIGRSTSMRSGADSNGTGVNIANDTQSSGENFSVSGSNGTSHSTSHGSSEGISVGITDGVSTGVNESTSLGTNQSTSSSTSESVTEGKSYAETNGTSKTFTTSKTHTNGTASTNGTGRNQTLHRRPLLHPDEVGRAFPRIDDTNNARYPGLALVIVSGCNPFVVRRAQYFEDPEFMGKFSPHPDHGFRDPALHAVDGIRPLIQKLEAAMNGACLTVSQWLIQCDEVTFEKYAARIDGCPPDNRTVYIETPCPGKVSQLDAASEDNKLSSGEYLIPDGPLFSIKNYSQKALADPFGQLRQACIDLEKVSEQREAPQPAPPHVAPSPQPKKPFDWQAAGDITIVILVIAAIALVCWLVYIAVMAVVAFVTVHWFISICIGIVLFFCIGIVLFLILCGVIAAMLGF